MSQQGYVAAPPYSQAQAGMGGYSTGFGNPPPQSHYGYGSPPQGYSAPQTGKVNRLLLSSFLKLASFILSLCLSLGK